MISVITASDSMAVSLRLICTFPTFEFFSVTFGPFPSSFTNRLSNEATLATMASSTINSPFTVMPFNSTEFLTFVVTTALLVTAKLETVI